MYMINELILETLDKGKEIGKKEVLKDVLDWLGENFYNEIDMDFDYYNSEYYSEYAYSALLYDYYEYPLSKQSNLQYQRNHLQLQ